MRISKRSFLMTSIILCIMVLALAACASNDTEGENVNSNGNENIGEGADVNNDENNNLENEGNNAVEDLPEEVELIVQYHRDDFDETIKEPVENEFPHITLEQIGTDGDDMDELFASGIVPDISMPSAHVINHLVDNELAMDMTELIEANNFDLNRLDDSFMEFMEFQSGDRGLIALPYKIGGGSALYYNKDVFDEFGVSYPDDGLTWSEVIDLARDLTAERDGVDYRGLDLDVFYLARNQLEAYPIDPETGQPTFDELEEWRMLVDLFREVIEIPGNYDFMPAGEYSWNWGYDFRQGNVAMRIGPNNVRQFLEEDLPFEWDVASFPVWEHKPGVAPANFEFAIAVTQFSENQDAAWDVVEYLLSDEHQTWLGREGVTIPVVDDPEIRSQFMADLPEVQELNIDVFTEYEFAVQAQAPPGYPFLRIDAAELREFFDSDHRDPAVFLRELQEQGETEILEYQQQN